ncbi:hypothetical protein DPMN_029949 [Dreissena polymorpha]|uniref:Uncharacterized protein n=1 Tax=Dreissena polymorpha TaxID=45954 RepID=A0A9D4LZH0_DREPO|nr:hypothetical protein DPMN_029949 [Dreissena polymorpha]
MNAETPGYSTTTRLPTFCPDFQYFEVGDIRSSIGEGSNSFVASRVPVVSDSCNSFYKVIEKDAMGNKVVHRGFSDPNLFAAQKKGLGKQRRPRRPYLESTLRDFGTSRLTPYLAAREALNLDMGKLCRILVEK